MSVHFGDGFPGGLCCHTDPTGTQVPYGYLIFYRYSCTHKYFTSYTINGDCGVVLKYDSKERNKEI